MGHPFGIGNAQFRNAKQSAFVDTVYLGFYRREVFDQIGYFDDSSSIVSEDSDMNERIRAAGGKIYLDTRVRSIYEPRESFNAQTSLYFRYGAARAGNVLKHKRFSSLRQTVAPLFLACLVSLPILGIFGRVWLIPWGLVLVTYLTADAIFSVWLGVREREIALAPLLFVTFPCMHLAWASGFWKKMLIPEKKGHVWRG